MEQPKDLCACDGRPCQGICRETNLHRDTDHTCPSVFRPAKKRRPRKESQE